MTARPGKYLVLVALLVLAACSGGSPKLLNVGAGLKSPDEFGVLPGKPLQTPKNLSALPPPTPGGSNLTDPTPQADAVAALGGRRSAVDTTGIPAADAALLNYTGRDGIAPNLRADLAADDLAYRKRKNYNFLGRWFGGNQYYKAYARFALDPYAELRRLRALGIETPSAPPAP